MLLNEKGASVNSVDINCDSIIHWAILMENIDLLKYLAGNFKVDFDIMNKVD